MFLVEPFSKMEKFNVERSSALKSPPENVLAETDSYTHSTFRNLSIEGHIRVDSSNFPYSLHTWRLGREPYEKQQEEQTLNDISSRANIRRRDSQSLVSLGWSELAILSARLNDLQHV